MKKIQTSIFKIMNKAFIPLNIITLAIFIYHNTKNILYMFFIIPMGFLVASIFIYWRYKILPTKKALCVLLYLIILGLLLKLIF